MPVLYGITAVLATALLATAYRWRHLRRAASRERAAGRLGHAALLRDHHVLEELLAQEEARELVLAEAARVVDLALSAVYGEHEEGGGDV
jgi:hypothetical protein